MYIYRDIVYTYVYIYTRDHTCKFVATVFAKVQYQRVSTRVHLGQFAEKKQARADKVEELHGLPMKKNRALPFGVIKHG